MVVGLTLSILSISLLHTPFSPPSFEVAVSRTPNNICMMAKRGRKAKEVVEEVEEEPIERDDESRGMKMVDAMTTSLGREDELLPFPTGRQNDHSEDEKELLMFVHCGLFTPQHMPGEALQESYLRWLASSEARPNIELTTANYMLSEQTVENYWETGDVITDDDIARMDAAEEEAEAAAAAAAAASAAAAEEGDGEGPAPELLPPSAALEMVPSDVAFVLGHLTVFGATSHDAAAAWMTSNPLLNAGGYADAQLHEWVRSTDDALSMRATGDCLQTYCVHCLDRADAGDLRAKTRDAHLAWLRESGRVVMAGPLLEPSSESSADAPRVGTLLIVNGDDLNEVEDWTKADPYAAAGLFDKVVVAPLNTYAVSTSSPPSDA